MGEPMDARTGCYEVEWAGTGFMLVARRVFEQLILAYPERRIDDAQVGRMAKTDPKVPWCQEFFPIGVARGDYFGEDVGYSADFGGLIAERTKDGIAAARANGRHPGRQPLDRDKADAALKLVAAGLSPTAAAKQVGLGRSTVYRELVASGTHRAAR